MECEPGDNILQDRIYINDRSGDVSKGAKSLLPRITSSRSIVTAADTDKDGRDELCIRVTGKYWQIS